MRREAVAQRVRRGALRQTQQRAQFRHLPLHQPRIERPAARADEERPVRRKRVRAVGEIVAHRRRDRGQHRHHARLAPLAGDGERARLPPAPRAASGPAPRRAAGRRRRASVSIAVSRLPLPARRARDRRRGRAPPAHPLRRSAFGTDCGALGRAHGGERRVADEAAPIEKAEEPAHHRHEARGRAALEAGIGAARQRRAKIRRRQRGECREVGRAAADAPPGNRGTRRDRSP